MTINALPADRTDPKDGAVFDAPIEFDLDAGHVAITPMHIDGETRFALTEIPAGPLTENDVEGLAAALHLARPGSAVLVNIDDYTEAD